MQSPTTRIDASLSRIDASLSVDSRILFIACHPCLAGKLWVPATAINLAFVPPLFRVLYLNCVFFFWSIYLSLILNKKEE
jgi:hypothetical protein